MTRTRNGNGSVAMSTRLVYRISLFLFVINALIILLAAKFVNGFRVDGFWWALLFSLLLSILTSFLYKKSTRTEN